MASGYELFDPFNYIQPGPFISKYSDWITFTLLLVFFVSVAGIALHRHFQENRYLKPLIISVGLILTVGTYYAIFKGWLHLSFQGFGFLGAFLLFIIIFFIAYSLVRAFGVQRSSAISIGYALLYTSLWVASPNIFDTIANKLPIINLVLLILFITSIFKFISAFFRHTKSPLVAAKELSNARLVAPPSTETDNEIQNELSDERKERKLIPSKSAARVLL